MDNTITGKEIIEEYLRVLKELERSSNRLHINLDSRSFDSLLDENYLYLEKFEELMNTKYKKL